MDETDSKLTEAAVSLERKAAWDDLLAMLRNGLHSDVAWENFNRDELYERHGFRPESDR